MATLRILLWALAAALLAQGGCASRKHEVAEPLRGLVRIEIRLEDGRTGWGNGALRADGSVVCMLSAFDDAAGVRVHANSGRVGESLGLAGYHAGANLALVEVDWRGAPPAALDLACAGPTVGARVRGIEPDNPKGRTTAAAVRERHGVVRLRGAEAFDVRWATFNDLWTTGGAVLDESGRLAGIATHMRINGEPWPWPLIVLPVVGARVIRPELLASVEGGESIPWDTWRGTRGPAVWRAQRDGAHAVQAATSGRTDEARRLAQESLGLDARCGAAWQALAVAAHREQRWPEAIEAWQRVIAITPTDARSRANLAVLMAGTGNMDEGMRLGRVAVEQAPDDPCTHKCLGWLLARERRFPEALDAYRVAARLDPHDRDLQREISRLESADRSVRAKPLLFGVEERTAIELPDLGDTGTQRFQLKLNSRSDPVPAETPPPR